MCWQRQVLCKTTPLQSDHAMNAAMSNTVLPDTQSIVQYRGRRKGYRCGYCGNMTGKQSKGMWAHVLTVEDYQNLVDKGWRRSGKYCYKPTMNKTCCPQYAIRQHSLEFRLSKSQKKVLKEVHRYLSEDIRPRHHEEHEREPGDRSRSRVEPSTLQLSEVVAAGQYAEPNTHEETVQLRHGTCAPSSPSICSDKDDRPSLSGNSHPSQNAKTKAPTPGIGTDPNKPPCQKAKHIRLERKRQKLAAKGLTMNPTRRLMSEPSGKTVADFIGEIKADGAHKLEIKLIRSSPRSNEFQATFKEEFLLYKKYQVSIHNDKPEECTETQFARFLVDSPLLATGNGGSGTEGYGSFHQQYWLDGKMIAVGVLDILPNCTSSVYLFYDPDYWFLSLGTYSALREIEFVQCLHKKIPDIKYYYMGYYIHSCVKMRYKGQYNPSFLLCPETYTWVSIERCRPKLDAMRYSRLQDTPQAPGNEVSLKDVLVLSDHQAMSYMIYKTLSESSDGDEVSEYATLVGRDCYTRMLLYRS